MSYRVKVPESSISDTDRWSRSLPKEEDVRTFVRLSLQRSIPGHEEISKEDGFRDPLYDTLNIIPQSEEVDDEGELVRERRFESYNWARTLKRPIVIDQPEPNGTMATGTVVATDELNAWNQSDTIKPYTYLLAGGGQYSWIRTRRAVVNSASDVRYAVQNYIHHSLEQFVQQGREMLRTRLASEGYTRRMGERELLKELDLRRSQYPGSQLIMFVGDTVHKYLRQTYDNPEQEFNTIIVRDNGHNNTASVMAVEQVGMNQEILYDYKIDRLPRYWEIRMAMVNRLALHLDPKTTSPEVIKEKGTRQLDLE